MDNRYLILHKNIPVITVSLNHKYAIEKIEKIHNNERIPIGLEKQKLNIENINDWFFSRAIPQKREGLSYILNATDTKNNMELLVKNLGLGLIDNYWIKKENSNLKWEEVNFFDNNFSNEVNGIYLNRSDKINEEILDKINPNNASSGMLPKGWICLQTDSSRTVSSRTEGSRKNKRFLIKGSELQNEQEPYNEEIISKWLDLLKVEHVEYEVKIIDKRPYSICELLLKENEELIHAYHVAKIKPKDNKRSYFEHYIDCCKELGLKDDIRTDLDNMILIDYMSANTDRHWNNFGIIRDSNSLKAKRLAPIYDNGASLFAKIPVFYIKEENINLKCQSFNTRQSQNIKNVKNFDLLEKKEIYSILDIAEQVFKSNKHMEDKRIKEILIEIKQRIITASKKREV